jgi:hypothetical protein
MHNFHRSKEKNNPSQKRKSGKLREWIKTPQLLMEEGDVSDSSCLDEDGSVKGQEGPNGHINAVVSSGDDDGEEEEKVGSEAQEESRSSERDQQLYSWNDPSTWVQFYDDWEPVVLYQVCKDATCPPEEAKLTHPQTGSIYICHAALAPQVPNANSTNCERCCYSP